MGLMKVMSRSSPAISRSTNGWRSQPGLQSEPSQLRPVARKTKIEVVTQR